MRAIPLLLAVTIMIPTLLAGASGCEMTTSAPEFDTSDTPAGSYYVALDGCCGDGRFSIWIYQESNGIDGLQRHDDFVDDTCDGAAGAGDTIIF